MLLSQRQKENKWKEQRKLIRIISHHQVNKNTYIMGISEKNNERGKHLKNQG
jgi:hypothetical protein